MKKLAELSWKDAQQAKASGSGVVLLPIGSTEAHGPHLPLGTDVIISEELCLRVAAALEPARPVIVAPSLSYAVTDYAGEFDGTVTLPSGTAVALVRDVCLSLLRQGFARVVLVNSHLEPAHLETLRSAATQAGIATGQKVLFPDACSRRWARTLTEEFKSGACHAGRYETSLVLAARPGLVKDDERAALPPKPIDLARAMKAGVATFREAGADQAYFGDPASATAVHGNEIYALLVTMVATEIAEAFPLRA